MDFQARLWPANIERNKSNRARLSNDDFADDFPYRFDIDRPCPEQFYPVVGASCATGAVGVVRQANHCAGESVVAAGSIDAHGDFGSELLFDDPGIFGRWLSGDVAARPGQRGVRRGEQLPVQVVIRNLQPNSPRSRTFPATNFGPRSRVR